jgi:uncharacterized protein YukE/GNAT superfamily N-acetyltransferase
LGGSEEALADRADPTTAQGTGEPPYLMVAASELVGHADYVASKVGGQVRTAQQAGETVHLGTDAYGVLCAFVPPLLSGVHGVILDGMSQAIMSLTETGARLRTSGAIFRSMQAAHLDQVENLTKRIEDPQHRITSQRVTLAPLVAPVPDIQPDASAGIWILEDIDAIRQGIKNQSWIETTLGVVATSLDGLGLIVDPIGSLMSYGISWLIEHLAPLREALERLTGSPTQVAAHAQTWRNIATTLYQAATDLTDANATRLPSWQGRSANSYQAWGTQQSTAIRALASAAETMAEGTELAGMLVAAVRGLIRDVIAILVGRLAWYAAEELITLGGASLLVLAQVTSLISATAARIAEFLRALFVSLRRLIALVEKLRPLIDQLKQLLGRLRGQRSTTDRPPEPDPGGAGRPASVKPPRVSFDDWAAMQADGRTAVGQEIFGGTFGGLEARVVQVPGGGASFQGHLFVDGAIYAPDGTQVGRFERDLHRDAKGNLVVDHTELKIDEGYRGQGFAELFNANAERWYRAAGVDRIELETSEVGGYAWARQGFDFASGTVPQTVRENLGEELRLDPGNAPLADLVRRIDAGERVSAYEISQVGREPGQAGADASWAGKRAMLGTHWRGVKKLGGLDGNQ